MPTSNSDPAVARGTVMAMIVDGKVCNVRIIGGAEDYDRTVHLTYPRSVEKCDASTNWDLVHVPMYTMDDIKEVTKGWSERSRIGAELRFKAGESFEFEGELWYAPVLGKVRVITMPFTHAFDLKELLEAK